MAAAPTGAGEHLLAGARLFRGERWAEALVEFRVAERLGDRAARGYAAAVLVKLDRPEQAVEEFESPGAPPVGRDALLDYYHALACHDSHLLIRADRLFEAVGARAGPRIAALARTARSDIAALLSSEPASGSIDRYLARCVEVQAARRTALARAYCEEARDLGQRRRDRHGVAEAQSHLLEIQGVAEAR